jgi:hypothetical protein
LSRLDLGGTCPLPIAVLPLFQMCSFVIWRLCPRWSSKGDAKQSARCKDWKSYLH